METMHTSEGIHSIKVFVSKGFIVIVPIVIVTVIVVVVATIPIAVVVFVIVFVAVAVVIVISFVVAIVIVIAIDTAPSPPSFYQSICSHVQLTFVILAFIIYSSCAGCISPIDCIRSCRGDEQREFDRRSR